MSKKHKKKHGEEEGGEAWLLPYSDLMTLLLAVFIVLFAVSKVDETQAEAIAEAFRDNMMIESAGENPDEGGSVIPLYPEVIEGEIPQEEETDTSHSEEHTNEEDTTEEETAVEDEKATQEELEEFLGEAELKNLADLKDELDTNLEEKNMTASITTSIDMRGLVISLNNAILFDSGSAEIKKQNEDELLEVADLIATIDNYIRIEGHTDNIPMSSSEYPSNWELSTARAASVVRLLVEKGNISPDKLLAVGYGEYKPVADNSTAEGRAKNRRIDIIILSEKYNNLEEQITDTK